MTQANDADGGSAERLGQVIAGYLAALERGESPDPEALLAAHPDLTEALRAFFADHARMRDLVGPGGALAGLTGPYQGSPEPAGPDPVGTVLAGRYKLLQRIGEGGMGTVFMAEQTEPVRRLVAVKLIKAGMDSKQVLARFDAERQALALMDHPNIARILDGGRTADGRPYFVMELVRGLPILQYCDEKRLSVAQRLDLFRQVCAAVQHAHQKGVLHRDLKPTNVLVTEHDGTPVPKVIDFGLAKALHTPGLLTEKTLFTAVGTAVGTPAYMAPEQVGINALDVDTRADVYALGVLLYELLTGTTPVDRQRLKAAVWDEVRRLIREEEPPRPSQRLSTSDALPDIAARRDTEPAKLGRLVRGDLDWIVMKALEKDRDRRYETATAFAEDVRRFQADEPVAAGPPTLGYRLGKFVRRNRAAAAAAGIIGLAVLLAMAGLAWGLVQTQWALTRVTEEEKKTRDALSEADAQRKKAEVFAASIAVDLALSAPTEEMKLLRLARELRSIPDHARELREYVTLRVLVQGQLIEPLIARFTHDGFPVAGPATVSPKLTHKMTLSPDGRFVSTWSWGRTVRVWDALTGDRIGTLPDGPQDGRWLGVAFASSDRLYSVPEEDPVVRLWDATGKPVVKTAPFPGPVRLACLGPDRQRLVVVADRPDQGPATQVELLDGGSGRRIAELPGHPAPVTAVAVSPDGRWVLTGGANGKARAWSADDGRLVRDLDGHADELSWVGFNPTGTFACTLSGKELRWWRLPDWQPAGSISPGKGGPISTGAFVHPEVVYFLSVSQDGQWLPSVLVYRKGDPDRLVLEDGEVELVASDGKKVLTARGNVYDLDTRRLLLPSSGQRYHPDARRILGGRRLLLSSNGIIDLATEKEMPAGEDCRPLSAPGCLGVGRNLDALILTPALDVAIPPASLERWAQVVARGELNAQGQFVSWDEATWERKRQQLAALARPVGAFPFPGHIATDRLYWLRQAIREAGQAPEAVPLLDRLVSAEPTWARYLDRGSLLWRLNQVGPAARDLLEAGRRGGPPVWSWMGERPADLAWDIARLKDLPPDDYQAGLALALVRERHPRRPTRLLRATLLFRLARYAEALDLFAQEEIEKIGVCFASASASHWTAALWAHGVHSGIASEAVKAMCHFRLGRPEAAKLRLALARRVESERWQEWFHHADWGSSLPYEEELVFRREAEELIEGKNP